MNKFYILGLASLFVVQANAQKQTKTERKVKYAPEGTYETSEKQKATEKTIIWQNDFSAATDWAISNETGDAQDWTITTNNASTIGYNTGGWVDAANVVTNENGYALFDSDAVGSNGGNQNASITYKTPIDLTAHPYVVIQFYQRGRMWTTTQTFVEVSTDSMTTWSSFELNTTKANSIRFEELAQLNITSAAGGQDSVYLRFRYVGSWDYAWMIDDVKLIDQPMDDIINLNFFLAGDNNEGIEYGRTPQDQIDLNYTLGTSVVNFGVNSQTNITLDGGFINDTYSFVFNTGNGNPVASGDTIQLTSTVDMTGFITGVYQGSYMVYSDGEDSTSANYDNNTGLRNFEITTNLYSQDGIGVHPTATVGSMGSESFGNPTDTYLAAMYHLRGGNNLVSGFEIKLTPSTVAGGEIEISIIDTATFLADQLAPYVDGNNNQALSLVAQVGQDEVTAGVIHIPFIQPISLPDGAYYAVVRPMNSGSSPIYVYDDFTVEQPWYASMVNTLSDQGGAATAYSNGNAFAIRLMTGNQALVNELSGVNAMSVFPNPAKETATLSFQLANETTATVVVSDITGKIAFTKNLGSVTGAQSLVIPTADLSNGLYTVRVIANGSASIQKLIIE